MFDKWEELKKYIEYLIDLPKNMPPTVFFQLMGDKINFTPETMLEIMKAIEEEEKEIVGE